MSCVQDCHPWSFVHSSAFHPDEPILNQIDSPHSVLRPDPVKRIQQICRGEWLSVDRDRNAYLEFDLEGFGVIRSVLWRASHSEHAGWRLGPRILQYSALIA